MAILRSGEIFTAGANGARIESGHGSVLINGAEVNLSTLHFPLFDTLVSLSGGTANTVLDFSTLTLDSDIPEGGFSGGISGRRPTYTIPGGRGFGVTGISTTDERLQVNAFLPRYEIDIMGEATAVTTATGLGVGGAQIISGIFIPTGTTVESLGSTTTFVLQNAMDVPSALATAGVVDTTSTINIRSGKGQANISGIDLNLDTIRYPFNIPAGTEITVADGSIIFY